MGDLRRAVVEEVVGPSSNTSCSPQGGGTRLATESENRTKKLCYSTRSIAAKEVVHNRLV